MSGRRAVFLDRDGVINALVPDPQSGRPESPLRAPEVSLLPAVGAALRGLSAAGFLLIGVSNQPAAAKGTATREQLVDVQERVVELLAAEGVAFDDFRICWHHPDGSDPELSIACDCRKPAPGLLCAGARAHDVDLARSWTVGDSDSDVLAGASAGTRTILVEHSASAHRRRQGATPTLIAPDLAAAVPMLLDWDGR